VSGFALSIRTPQGIVFSGEVLAVRAEDESGWFGVRPGREDVVAVMPPGLLMLRDEQGEGFVAHAGGLLSVHGGSCRVTAREAAFTRALDDVAGRLEDLLRLRAARAEVQRDVLDRLAREALRRIVRERRR
jgi:F-type H+-transporting ATPase subunit epsilon